MQRWERIGHPLDTLTTALCYGWAVITPAAAPHALGIYVGLAAFSCLFITKDEFVHARLCDPKEIWLHAVLFVLHPAVLLAFGVLWGSGAYGWVLNTQLALTLAFFVYQLTYWNGFPIGKSSRQPMNSGSQGGASTQPGR